jgi:hypothetical protein
MTKKFTLFHQNQYGMYTADMCVDANLGTCHVGPGVALFLYNRAEKSCFAMHISPNSSFQLIYSLLERHFGDPNTLKHFEAFIVGGWEYQYADEDGAISSLNSMQFDIESIIKSLKIRSISATLNELNPEIKGTSEAEFYDVIFDLNDGNIMLFTHQEHDFEAIDLAPDELDLYDACDYYLENSCAYPITYSLHRLQELNPEYELSDGALEFLKHIIDESNGLAAIPAHNIRESAEHEMELLAEAIISKDALAVIKQLYLNFSFPMVAPPEWEGDTCLHYACRVLEADPNNFYLKINVVFLILYAKCDFKNDLGIVALAELKNPELQSFKKICQKLLKLFETYQQNQEVIIDIVHWYRIFAITTINNIVYCLENEEGITDSEAGFMEQLREKAEPVYWM